jgi:GNAT superfamily N-acetyltransferase
MIRKITIEDIPEIVKIGRLMHDESSYRDFFYSDGVCSELIKIWLEKEDMYFLMCEEKDGEIRGCIICCLVPHMYGDGRDLVASDLIVYVKPEYRGSSIFLKMVMLYESWAKKNGAKRICLAHSCEINDDKTDKIYQKLGYKYFAKAFKKGL